MKGLEMNTQQIAGWLRTTLAVSGPVAVLIMHKFGWSEGEYTLYLNAFLVVAPGVIAAVFDWRRNREASQIAITQALPVVTMIAVKDDAHGQVAELAKSSEVPKVVPESAVQK